MATAIGVLAGGWFFQQKKTAQESLTLGWKTYTDKVGRYTIQYPPEWYLREGTYIADGYWQAAFEKPSYPLYIGVSISVLENPRNLTPHEWAEEEYKGLTLDKAPDANVSYESLKIAGIESLKVRGIPNGSHFVIFLPSRSKMYRFAFNGGYEGLNVDLTSEELNIFTRMLSTFSFLK